MTPTTRPRVSYVIWPGGLYACCKRIADLLDAQEPDGAQQAMCGACGARLVREHGRWRWGGRER